MKRVRVLCFLIFCFLPISIFGQKAEFTKQHTYNASRDDSFNSAKAKAIQEAQTELLQQLGVLVEGRQKMTATTTGGKMQQDFVEELKTYTIGRVQTTVVDGTESFRDNVFRATFTMLVDTADLYKYLDNIVKQKERARADSLAKTRLVSELELAVKTARNILEQEQEKERPLKSGRDRKERDLIEAANERANAQKAFNNARNSGNAHTDIGAQRVENERRLLQKAIDNHNIKSSEFVNADENWKIADKRLQAAKSNLRTAENNLAKETGAETINYTVDRVDTGEQTLQASFAAAAKRQKTPQQKTPQQKRKRRIIIWSIIGGTCLYAWFIISPNVSGY